jgi:signal transduction histidine kinase
MRKTEVEVENVAEIVWGALLIIYLIGAGQAEFLRPSVLAVFGLSASAAFLELHLRRIQWKWLLAYDSIIWSVALSAMVAMTGGRGSELWPAYILMSLTAPSIGRRVATYGLLAVNSLVYLIIYMRVNPFGAPFNPTLVVLRVGVFFLVAYVVDRSMARERAAKQARIDVMQNRVHELVQARDTERRRIAGEIHDWLGGGVVAPMRKLELALRAPDQATNQARLNEAITILSRGHQELRRVMENLHPHLLEQMGLAEALQAYVTQWGEEHGMATSFIAQGGAEPSLDVALALFRIQQEALTNVLKHATATRVSIRLLPSAEQITLIVADNGKGFVGGGRPTGRGVYGMTERAQVHGGTVTIHTGILEGTEVVATIPTLGAPPMPDQTS